jgi:phage terminase small subunit
MAGCVAGLEVVELYEGKGEDRKWTGRIKKIKFTDRNPAQHDLMDHLGLLSDRSPKIDLAVNVNREPSDLELSARALYLLKLAMERQEPIDVESKSEKD